MTSRGLLPLVLLLFSLLQGSAGASAEILFTLGNLTYDAWSLKRVQLALQRSTVPGSSRFKLSAESIEHPLLVTPVTDFKLVCVRGTLDYAQIGCASGTLSLNHERFQQTDTDIIFNVKNSYQLFELNIDNFKFGSSKSTLDIRLEGDRWDLRLETGSLSLSDAAALIQPYLGDALNGRVDGRLGGQVQLQGTGNTLLAANWRLALSEGQFADNSAEFLGEGIQAAWSGNLRQQNGQSESSHRLRMSEGAILTPWFYLGSENGAVTLDTGLSWTKNGSATSISIHDAGLRQGDLAEIELTAALLSDRATTDLDRLELSTSTVDLARFHSAYIEPLIAGTPWEGLSIAGTSKLQLDYRKGQLHSLSTDLMDVNLSYSQFDGELDREIVQLEGISGDLNWYRADHTDAGRKASRLGWREGLLYSGIGLGAVDLQFDLLGRRISLLEQGTLPVLDGYLQMESLVADFTQEEPGVAFKGYLTPISMERLTRSLDLHPLSGQISGMIPGVSLQSGALRIEGVTLLRLFDGEILIRNLLLDELFGVLPVLTADVQIRRLNLETLTETFAFGKITGELDGRIEQMRLEGWRPVSFDARLMTPEQYEGPRKISQKAVDNISNLGGAGISGALSRSFLRVFDEFGYARLGISCRLRQGVCTMGGVEEAPTGYYLVKGGGIPRIDIMGFNRETDWDILVEKLRQISSGEGPSIR